MHMVDALVSPLIGGTMWASATSASWVAYKQLPIEETERKIAQMGVMGAFVFAAQMINFAIPGTGASGHIGGGILLSILLGPAAAYLTMGMVLLIQALFFADGGLLAFGANWINMGFFTCFVAFPLVYQPLQRYFKKRGTLTPVKELVVTVLATVIGLQLGAFGVSLMTYFSHTTTISLTTFLAFMQSIHLVISLIEGVITGMAITFIRQHEPGMIYEKNSGVSLFKQYNKIIIVTVLVALILAYFASSNPDGLEWALEKINMSQTSGSGFESPIAFMPDYNLPENIKEKLPFDMTGLAGLIGVGFMLIIGLGVSRIYQKRLLNGSKPNE